MITLALPDPCVVVMLGAPGAGKTTLSARLTAAHPNAAVLSYADCRRELTGDETDQTVNEQVKALIRGRLAARCASGLTTVVDGTHTLPHRRTCLVEIAAAHGLPAVAVVLDVDLVVCLANQFRRARREPPGHVADLHTELTRHLPHLHREGFAQIHILRAVPTTPEPRHHHTMAGRAA
ncbi:AAA family ATPase [Actinokineospora iranica]|uniref:Predicted kinase n=1 Tax=Actinokineospora iranica TaxID=1271860 RepID=A0A1G6WSA4_9PSEU|nr:AAA family ATPase [Actinokineospora iranica]SDD68097.1 Predicted kinase [Actinokineospora iranica]